MFAILHALGMLVADLFKSRSRLEAEIVFLRHQLNIALRRAPPRIRLRRSDRALFILMTKLWPTLLGAAQVVQPETILRWHRAGFIRKRGNWVYRAARCCLITAGPSLKDLRGSSWKALDDRLEHEMAARFQSHRCSQFYSNRRATSPLSIGFPLKE